MMRKKMLLFIIMLLIAQSLSFVSAEENVYIPDISMKISSNCIETSSEVIELDEKATLKEGRSYFPLRGIAEFYGIKVDFVPETQTIILRDSYLVASLQIGGNELVISYDNYPIEDRTITLDAPAYISENGRTMLPIRAVAEEVFGCEVEWDDSAKKIKLSKFYQSKRLIAKASSEEYQYAIDNAVISESGFKNVSFIDFPSDTPDGVIRYYCRQLIADDDIIYAEPDVILQAQLP